MYRLHELICFALVVIAAVDNEPFRNQSGNWIFPTCIGEYGWG